MNKSDLKRKRVDVSCPAPEDASSFYKRLGLDILAPSSTSGQTEEARPPKKRPVQQASHTAPLTTTPTQRPDRVGHQRNQSQQRERQAPHHFRQNYPHENRYNERAASLNTAATYRPQYAPVHRPHEQQTQYRTGVVPSSNSYQPQHAQPTRPHGFQTQTRPNYVNGNSNPQQHRVHPTHPHTRTESISTVASHKPQHVQQPQQRVVRKEPQVKPINKYAPPDYMTLMYHPTPTLEDLGLTSYLESPPSSPRTRSPAREEKTAGSQPERESARRVLPAWDAPTNDFFDRESKTTNSQAREFRIAVSADKQFSKIDTVSAAKKSAFNVTNQMSERHQIKVTNQMNERHQTHLTNQMGEKPQTNVTNPMSERQQAVSHTQMNKHLATNVETQRYVPSFVPKGWDPQYKSSKSLQGPVSTESVINATSGSATFTAPISKSVAGQPTNNKRPGSGSTLAENPEKRACNWSMIAEQYSSESRHSVNQEQRRDALYRRYSKDERQQTHITKRHQNHDTMYQEHTNVPSRNKTFDQILAEQIARQAELKSKNHSQAPQTGTNTSEERITCQPITKSSLPIVKMDDLFGGLSPYSCWNHSGPEDPRFS